jgi:hypothetical protein
MSLLGREIEFRGVCNNFDIQYFTFENINCNRLFFRELGLWKDLDKCKIDRYTELKDQINKNKVYEHDIINHMRFGFMVVEWNYKETGWVCISKTFNKVWLVDVLLQGGIRVGNIYKNPELLKDRINEFLK